MKKFALMLAAIGMLTLPGVVHADVLLDNFNTPNGGHLVTRDSAGTSNSSVAAAGALGGTRELELTYLDGTESATLSANRNGSGVLNFSQDSGVTAAGSVFWDGTADDTLDEGGLGGIDLSGATSLDIRAGSDLGVVVRFTIFDTLGGASSVDLELDADGAGFGLSNISIPIGDFVGDADLSTVGAVTLEINLDEDADVDARFDNFIFRIPNGDVPEPASFFVFGLALSGGLVWRWRKSRLVA